MRIIIFSISFSLLVLSNAGAYSPKDCGNFFRQEGFYGLFNFSVTSSFQFVSSTGECSAMGFYKGNEDENFFVVNRALIETDIAKGSGEYLKAITFMWSCDKIEVSSLNEVRSNFSNFVRMNNKQAFQFLKLSMACSVGPTA